MAADIQQRLAYCTGFEWDEGNPPRLLARHNVTMAECEQVFFNEPLIVADDLVHSGAEPRWAAWGQTDDGRQLAVIFTLRGDRIRPLSARDMNRKERKRYDEAEADS